MKQSIFILIISLFAATQIFAQAPQTINFQAVARDQNGVPNANATVQVEFIIRENSMSGTIKYNSGAHNFQTDACGMFTAKIGSDNPTDFANVDWASGTKFLEVKANGLTIGNQQMVSVPYALYAEKSGSPSGSAGGDLNGSYPNPTVDGIQGKPVSATAPTQGQVMMFDNGKWKPANSPDIAIFEEWPNHNQAPQNDPVITWNTRQLNHEVQASPSGAVVLQADFTLKFNQTGKYLVIASAPANRCSRHRIALKKQVSPEVVEIFGTSEFSTSNLDQSRSHLMGVLTVTDVGATYRLDHFLQNVNNANGEFLGIETNLPQPNNTIDDHETYAQIMVQKIQ